tara:strand:- start:1174 stop:1338 length:165 start_codon:yes stop_codon:yes gene_type:complete
VWFIDPSFLIMGKPKVFGAALPNNSQEPPPFLQELIKFLDANGKFPLLLGRGSA